MVWSGDAAFGRKLAEIVLVLLLVERRRGDVPRTAVLTSQNAICFTVSLFALVSNFSENPIHEIPTNLIKTNQFLKNTSRLFRCMASLSGGGSTGEL